MLESCTFQSFWTVWFKNLWFNCYSKSIIIKVLWVLRKLYQSWLPVNLEKILSDDRTLNLSNMIPFFRTHSLCSILGAILQFLNHKQEDKEQVLCLAWKLFAKQRVNSDIRCLSLDLAISSTKRKVLLIMIVCTMRATLLIVFRSKWLERHYVSQTIPAEKSTTSTSSSTENIFENPGAAKNRIIFLFRRKYSLCIIVVRHLFYSLIVDC